MKKSLLVLLSVFAIVTQAFAGTEPETHPVLTGNSASQDQNQQQASQSAAVNAGNNQYVVFNGPEKTVSEANVTYGGTQTLRNVPSVSGPQLITSNDTCMGSSSGSVNLAGFGGSYGTTWTDENCVMLKNSRELWNMGMHLAGLARMCFDGMNKEALELTGFECPQTKRERETGVKAKPQAQQPEITDPFVRKRMGLKPLE